MRIGFDVDGVLANFSANYAPLLAEVAGRNLFLPGDIENPPCWLWDEYRGYTKAETRATWDVVKASGRFWLDLPPLNGASTLAMVLPDLQRNHDIYFVTNRMGLDAKWQTEAWLKLHVGVDTPTVLVSAQKGLIAAGLKLDCYVDDNLDNANDVAEKTGPDPAVATRTYLLDKSYNRSNTRELLGNFGNGPLDPHVMRVSTLGQFLDAELTNL